MSSGSYSANQEKDVDYGQGGYRQYAAPYNNDAAPPSHSDGMSMQPSVGRFTEQEKGNAMFSRKPSTPVLAPPSTSIVSQDSSASHCSGGIVNLRGAPRAEGKMNKLAAKGKK